MIIRMIKALSNLITKIYRIAFCCALFLRKKMVYQQFCKVVILHGISLAEFIYLMFIIKTKNIFNIHIWCCHKVILICFYDYKDKQFFLNAITFIKKLYAHQYNLFRKTE